jgi:hypothetical protein
LGVFNNGGTYEITEEQAVNFRAANPVATPVVGDENEILGLEVEHGPTLLQASRSMVEGINVSTYHEDDDQEDELPDDEDEDEGHTLVEDDGMQLDEGSDG